MKITAAKLWFCLTLLLALSLLPRALAVSPEVTAKVQEICAQCRQECADDEYEQALWLHDWLTANADYDTTYTEYGPDGVLLRGTGVCQSYAEAYALLLDGFEIENRFVTSEEINHIWNLVRIDGEWCHIDVTWDDPGTGGNESHVYFGMNDTLISRDHPLEGNRTPSDSVKNYYPCRNGYICFADTAELEEMLAPLAESQTETLLLCYVGAEADFVLQEAFVDWFGTWNWKYGMYDFTSYASSYEGTYTLYYTDPWEKPDTRQEDPLAAPDFSMNSPTGCYKKADYTENSLLLIFGRCSCLNTRALLRDLSSETEKLKKAGIQVLVSMENTDCPDDLKEISALYPNFTYVYNQSTLLWQYLAKVGVTSGNVTYPCVFVVNSEGKITYYSTDYVSNVSILVSEAFATATGNPLPSPHANEYGGNKSLSGNLTSVCDSVWVTEEDKSWNAVLRALSEEVQTHSTVIFLTDYQAYYYDTVMMQKWEEKYELYSKLGISFVACFQKTDGLTVSDYPHVRFVTYNAKDDFFWQLLRAVKFNLTQGAYYQCCYVLDGDGNFRDFVTGDTLNVYSIAMGSLNRVKFDLELPESLTTLDSESFEGTVFTSASLEGTQVTSLPDKVFANCGELRLIRIPATVTEIADSAFDGTSSELVILCDYNSVAYEYANSHGITCVCK